MTKRDYSLGVMKAAFLAWLVAMLLAGSSVEVSAQESYADRLKLFDYDLAQPLNLHISPKTDSVGYGVTVRYIDYASPVVGQVTALVVVPFESEGIELPVTRPAGIIFLHWGQGDKTEFVWEATLYARAGAVSILVDAPWARPEPWTQPGESYSDPDRTRQMYIQNVKDLRRAVDVVLHWGVDPQRIAYVGHSFGATQGGVLAGVEKRIKTFILMAGLPTLADFSMGGAKNLDALNKAVLEGLSKDQVASYIAAISPLTPADFISHSAPASVFMQFATYDSWIPRAAAERYFAAAGVPKQIKWYLTSHEFTNADALADRASWLQKEIWLGTVQLGPTAGPHRP
jgi:pimeloyl-ACP methyl ester carboxylesterase